MNGLRPTKKQRILLDYVGAFITEHGYSPSYREIMNGCGYNSIATVAVHINNLISRGHLCKRDHSARSLELTVNEDIQKGGNDTADLEVALQSQEWLVDKVKHFFDVAETTTRDKDTKGFEYKKAQTLVEALEILELDSAALSFSSRLQALKQLNRTESDKKDVQ